MAIRRLYHGLDGKKLEKALETGCLIPDSSNELYFDYTNYANCFKHGVDLQRKKSFVIGVDVDLDGYHWRAEQKHGNPTTLIVTTSEPFPVEIQELYVRTGRADEGFSISRIVGEDEMKHQLAEAQE